MSPQVVSRCALFSTTSDEFVCQRNCSGWRTPTGFRSDRAASSGACLRCVATPPERPCSRFGAEDGRNPRCQTVAGAPALMLFARGRVRDLHRRVEMDKGKHFAGITSIRTPCSAGGHCDRDSQFLAAQQDLVGNSE